jgi:D-alanine-D-alanine ligase
VPDAREIECGVLGNDLPEASVPGEIVPSREFYDYEAKYIDGSSRLVIPAELDPAVEDAVRRQAIAAFQAIDGAGLARVDFLLSRSTGELFVNEINTLPGFTTISMYAKLWAASRVDQATLIDRLIALAIERHAEKHHARVSTS